jgi:phenylacetate-CoA ligase
MGQLRRTAFWTAERLRRRPTAALVREMESAERLTPAALAELVDRRVAALVARVTREVPHYAQSLAGAGEVRGVADLARLPFLDKAAIRAAGASILHPAGGPYRVTETGGSTGDPLKIHESPLRQATAVAARIRSRAWWGVEVGDAELVLFGGKASQRGALGVLKDEVLGSVTYSAFGMTPAHFDVVAARMARMRPRHLFGYTSALCAFARHLRESRGRADAGAGHGVEVVFTTSEMLFPADRALLEQTFAARVADGYGSKEAGFIAHECREGRMHVRADTHAVEIVQGDRVLPPGEEGEIVATHLVDWHWPFVRYRTGDAGTISPEPCACGLPLPVLRVTGGRITDLLVRKDGGLVHGLGAIYPVRETPGVVRFQVHQRSLDEVDVLLVVGAGFPADGDARIAARLSETLGGARVTVRHVDAIEQAASGKYRVVRSDVAPKRL